MRPTASRMI